jgi:hypothetical protein
MSGCLAHQHSPLHILSITFFTHLHIRIAQIQPLTYLFLFLFFLYIFFSFLYIPFFFFILSRQTNWSLIKYFPSPYQIKIKNTLSTPTLISKVKSKFKLLHPLRLGHIIVFHLLACNEFINKEWDKKAQRGLTKG